MNWNDLFIFLMHLDKQIAGFFDHKFLQKKLGIYQGYRHLPMKEMKNDFFR